jgi:hypothetical protein
MKDFPHSALSLAGFVLAHAAWSVSDTADDELLCPLAVVEQPNGDRRLLRFEADTQEEAIAAGKAAMRQASRDAAAWAFAREGAWRPDGAGEPQDVVTVDFWARGMSGPGTLLQAFERYTRAGRFRVLGRAVLVADGQVVEADVARSTLDAIEAGVVTHPNVAELWPTWL